MEVKEALETIKGCDLKGKYGVKRLGFFGSLARNVQKETSDVDVLVEFEND